MYTIHVFYPLTWIVFIVKKGLEIKIIKKHKNKKKVFYFLYIYIYFY